MRRFRAERQRPAGGRRRGPAPPRHGGGPAAPGALACDQAHGKAALRPAVRPSGPGQTPVRRRPSAAPQVPMSQEALAICGRAPMLSSTVSVHRYALVRWSMCPVIHGKAAEGRTRRGNGQTDGTFNRTGRAADVSGGPNGSDRGRRARAGLGGSSGAARPQVRRATKSSS
jgi:hypothetical protein